MDLYYLKGSPWSVRVIWFYSYLPEMIKKEITLKAVRDAEEVAPLVKSGENYLNPTSEQKILTLPMLFLKEGEKVRYFNDGIEIVKFLGQKAADLETDGFPAKQINLMEAVETWNNKTDVGMRFARYLFVTAKEDFVKYLAPTFVTYIPFATKLITQSFQKKRRVKYYGDESKIPDQKDVEAVVAEVNGIIEQQTFILGDEFTYADISFTVMLEAILPTNIVKPLTAYGSLTPMTAKEFKKNGWEEKYPRAFDLRARVMKDHLSEEALGLAGPELKRKINQL